MALLKLFKSHKASMIGAGFLMGCIFAGCSAVFYDEIQPSLEIVKACELRQDANYCVHQNK